VAASDNTLQQRGFTLLELLIVLMLIGVITGLVTPKLGGSLSTLQVKTTVNKISAMLRYARNVAVTDQKTRVVSFDSEKRQISLALSEQADIQSERQGNQERKKSYEQKVYQLPEGISIEKAYDGRGLRVDAKKDFKLFFYPAGNSSGGEIVLKGQRAGLYRIRVNFITGIIDVSD